MCVYTKLKCIPSMIDTWKKNFFVPPDYFSQTERLLIVENVPQEKISQTVSLLIWATCSIFSEKLSPCRGLKFTLLRCQFIRLIWKAWLTAHAVVSFKLRFGLFGCSYISSYIVKKIQKHFLQIYRDYFIRIPTVKLLQFLTFISDHSVFNKLYSNAFFKTIRES